MKIIVAISLLLMTAAGLQSRMIRFWSYAEMLKASDLVVIATPLSNTMTKDVFDGKTGGYVGIDTGFEIKQAIKGDIAGGKFTVLHFKHDPHSGWADGMEVVLFRLKGITMDVISVQKEGAPRDNDKAHISLPAPDYLLFLKKRDDGRYEPVTGQMDAMESVREVNRPLPFHNEE